MRSIVKYVKLCVNITLQSQKHKGEKGLHQNYQIVMTIW